tara:strand:+ start:400 stop:585 length:186 start_codon:yes stop_codon:yes gene_type:complete
MKLEKLKQIVKEEILIRKYNGISVINEEVTNEDEDKIRKIIRQEVSAIFFELFKKRRSWGA